MEIQIFKNERFGEVRTMVINDEPWFVGKDVAEVLGYRLARKALYDHVEDDDKKGVPIQNPLGGRQQITIINESGLYALILSSKLPQAKEFKRWVASEVLGYAILRMLSQGMWMQKIKGGRDSRPQVKEEDKTTFVISESGSMVL